MYIDFCQNNDTEKYFFDLTSFDLSMLGQKPPKFDFQIHFAMSQIMRATWINNFFGKVHTF